MRNNMEDTICQIKLEANLEMALSIEDYESAIIIRDLLNNRYEN